MLVGLFPLLGMGLRVAAVICDSAKGRYHTAGFLMDLAVVIVMCHSQRTPMGVYVHVHLSKVARLLLLTLS